MNRKRIIGVVILIIGVIVRFFLENDVTDFISGILVGLGIGLLITGRFVNNTI